MKFELWHSESKSFAVLLHEGDVSSAKPLDARLIWTVEANSYAEALQKRNKFLERNGIQFVSTSDEDARQKFQDLAGPTTRVTLIAYVDQSGNQRSFEIPGWVASTPDHLAEAPSDLALVVGQVYVERPYVDASDLPDEFTFVELRSIDGTEFMAQEFLGHIYDQAHVEMLVQLRLGPDIARWRIVAATMMKSPERQSPSLQEQKPAEENTLATRSPMDPAVRYEGCNTFVDMTGNAGFALGNDGDLYDLFATPHANETVVYDLMSQAIKQGATKLVTYHHPLLASFFEQFGFQAVCLIDSRSVPPSWVPESCRSVTAPISCPNFLCMILTNPTLRPANSHVPSAQDPLRASHTLDSEQEFCARCRGAIANRISGFGVFDGYNCPHCGFIYICGTLTLGPEKPLSRQNPEPSSPSPQVEACPCGSGKAFSECHGSE